MALTLEQLLATKTKEELVEEMLLAMRGVGYVRKTGAGEGTVTLSGTAEDELDVVLKITAAGALGVATFQYSIDGGDSYNGSDVTVPGGGNYTLPDTGVVATFEDGPGDLDMSFLVGDFYAFSLTIPTLPTTSWHAGSTVRTLIEKDAEANEDLSTSIQNVAKGGFLATAEDLWMDLWMEDMYGTEREAGQVAQHTCILDDTADAGPHNITAGQLVAATATGLRFSNLAGGTLPQGGTLSLTFQAESRGTAYNVALGAINTLLTSLPGVSIENTALVQHGVNRETDDEGRKRCRARWGTLGSGATEDAYTTWARAASANVTRVKAKADPAIAGGVIVLLAGPGGGVDGATEDDVTDYITPRLPLGTVLDAHTATTQAVVVEATVYVAAGYGSSALADILANLTALIQGGTNSIGEELPGVEISDGTVKVYRADLIEQMQIVDGVRNVDIATLLPATDTTLADEQVAILSPTPDITIVEV